MVAGTAAALGAGVVPWALAVLLLLALAWVAWRLNVSRRRERWYREAFAANPDGILLCRADGQIVSANVRAAELFGRSAEAFSGERLADLLADTEAEPAADPGALLTRALAGEMQCLSWRRKPVAGDVSWLGVVVRGARVGGEAVAMVSLRDVTAQRVSAEVSRHREMLARGALEAVHDGVLVAEAETQRFVRCNPAICRMLGYREDELLRLSVRDIHPADALAEVEDSFDRQLRGELVLAAELPVKHKDGSVFFADITAAGLEIDGRHHAVGVFRDVTERLRASRAQRLSEARFRAIVDRSPMGVYLYQLEEDGRLVLADANPAADRIVGADNRQRIGKTIEDAFPALAETDIPERYRRAARDGIPMYRQDLEYRDGAIDGVYDVHAFQTSPGMVAVMFLDVTERKRSEEAVREAARFARATLDALPYEIAIVSESGKIQAVNRAWREFAAANADDPAAVCEGADYMAACRAATGGDNGGGEFGQAVMDVLAGGRDSFSLQYQCQGPDQERWFLGRVSRFSNEGPPRAVVAHVDISERVRLESRLRQATKMEAVGQLAGGVAHDFNNLLQAIQGYLELSLLDVADVSSVKHHVIEAQKALELAATLTRQLLTFSRREAIEVQLVDLNQTVLTLTKMLRRLLGEQIELVVDAYPGTATVEADPGQLEQVIMNLCINARDAMPDGGRLVIGTSRVTVEERTVRGRNVDPGQFVCLTVSDSGQGMTPEVMDRVFEPFFTTKEPGRGTGLGLATVYAIVEQCGGFIELESGVGEGTVFRVFLPARVAAEGDEKAGDRSEAAPGGGCETILLAEDDATVRGMVERVLRRAGYRLLVAEDGEEAVALFEEHRDQVDLAVLDVVMPRRSGTAVAAHIRERRPELPVLMSSGYSAEALPDLDAADQSFRLLRKPYRTRVLLRVMREMLDAFREA